MNTSEVRAHFDGRITAFSVAAGWQEPAANEARFVTGLAQQFKCLLRNLREFVGESVDYQRKTI